MKPQRSLGYTLCFLLAILLSGCGTSAKDKLVGHWTGKVEIDNAKYQQKLKETSGHPIQKALVEELIRAVKLGSMDFDLKDDDSYTLSIKLGPLSKDSYGDWKVLQDKGDRIKVQLTDHNGVTDQQTLVFKDANTFTVEAEGEASEFAVFRCRRGEKSDK
ncbi:MAG: hypothetical protein P8N76_22725 [Pirellulaceae bacterium]|nr:hypothetical protein [Pirellulaceae bacterium]